jgi:hypothetical protein
MWWSGRYCCAVWAIIKAASAGEAAQGVVQRADENAVSDEV